MKSKFMRYLRLAVVILVLVPALFVTAFAAAKTVEPITGCVTVTDSVGNGSLSNGVVTIQASGGLFSQTTNSVTITNGSSSKAKITFDYSASNYSAFSESSATGSKELVLEAGGKVTMSITGKKAVNSNTAKLTLSNFTYTEIIEGTAHITYNDLGSVTVGGAAVANGGSTSITGDGAKIVANPASGATFVAWVNKDNYEIISQSASYTLMPYANTMNLWAVFTTAEHEPYYKVGTTLYTSFSAANSAASSGSDKVVVVISDGTMPTGTYEISSGVSLLIPYAASDLTIDTSTSTDDSGGLASTWIHANVAFTSDQYDDGNVSNSSVKGVMEPDYSVYMTLTIPSGTTLNVNSGSKLVIGGTIVSGTTQTGGVCGATAGAHSNLVVDGTLNVNSGGVLSACGYVLGSGNVNIIGGSAYQPFTLMDYHDGHHTANSTKNANFPAYRYIMQNIRPELLISSGGKMYGYIDIYTQETDLTFIKITARHNVDCQMIIGTASDPQCLIKLTNGATVKATYDATDYVTITSGAAGSAYYSKAGKTHLTINGGATMGYLSISVNVPVVGSQTSNSNETDFPLPYHYDITLENGTYTLPYTLVLYPGASMTVKDGAELVVESKFVVLDGLRDYTGRATAVTIGSWYEYHYPSTADFKNNHSKGTYNGTANLVVDGTLTVNSEASFGGYVQTNGTGKVVMNGTPSATAGVGNVSTYGTPVNKYVGRTDHTLSAWLWEADGELISMTAGTTYYGVDAGDHTIASYDYIVYTIPGDTSTYTTVNDEALNADIIGSWCTVQNHSYTSTVTAPTCSGQGYTTHTCSACGNSYMDAYTGPSGIHRWSEGECTVCGADFIIFGANIKVTDGLDMFFYVQKSDVLSEDFYAVVTKTYADGRDDTVETIQFSAWENYSDTLWRFCFADISAKEMTDDITVVIYNSSEAQASATYTDTVNAYALRAMGNNSTDSKLLTALVDMLNYGAAAQYYFHYNEENPASPGDYASHASASVTSSDSRNAGNNYVGSTVSAKNNLLLTFYFQNINTDMTATVSYKDRDGEEVSYDVPGSEFVSYGSYLGVDVTGLKITEGRIPVTCEVKNSEGAVVAWATDSIESYVARQSSGNDVFALLMKFVDSANAYFLK